MFALRERMRSDQLRYGQGWIYAQPQKPALYTYRRVWQIDDWINKCLSRPGDPMSPLVLQHGQHFCNSLDHGMRDTFFGDKPLGIEQDRDWLEFGSGRLVWLRHPWPLLEVIAAGGDSEDAAVLEGRYEAARSSLLSRGTPLRAFDLDLDLVESATLRHRGSAPASFLAAAGCSAEFLNRLPSEQPAQRPASTLGLQLPYLLHQDDESRRDAEELRYCDQETQGRRSWYLHLSSLGLLRVRDLALLCLLRWRRHANFPYETAVRPGELDPRTGRPLLREERPRSEWARVFQPHLLPPFERRPVERFREDPYLPLRHLLQDLTAIEYLRGRRRCPLESPEGCAGRHPDLDGPYESGDLEPEGGWCAPPGVRYQCVDPDHLAHPERCLHLYRRPFRTSCYSLFERLAVARCLMSACATAIVEAPLPAAVVVERGCDLSVLAADVQRLINSRLPPPPPPSATDDASPAERPTGTPSSATSITGATVNVPLWTVALVAVCMMLLIRSEAFSFGVPPMLANLVLPLLLLLSMSGAMWLSLVAVSLTLHLMGLQPGWFMLPNFTLPTSIARQIYSVWRLTRPSSSDASGTTPNPSPPPPPSLLASTRICLLAIVTLSALYLFGYFISNLSMAFPASGWGRGR